MTHQALDDRLHADAPKRILALDGGGIRGAITLGYLERMERLLRERYQRPDLVLADYFDLIGGTSTGAVIAAALAIGMDAASVKQLYLDLGERIFKPVAPRWVPGPLRRLAVLAPNLSLKASGLGLDLTRRWFSTFDPAPLEAQLKETFGNRTLGDPDIRCGLCIVTKRADTGSLWPIHNNPRGKYFERNGGLLLRDVVRASSAAPIYFPPHTLNIGGDRTGAFVDGGVSLANNPALTLFLLVTIGGYTFNWPLGEDKLLLVSVGTGSWARHEDGEDVLGYGAWNWAAEVPAMFMSDAAWHVQLMLQAISNTPTRVRINREIGDLSDTLLTGEPLLSYIRYNVNLDETTMNSLRLPELASKAKGLRELSAAEHRHDLARIGERAAERDVEAAHFPPAFDLPS
jgi:predicted acylesterase/phospholipase RssA